MLKTALLLSLLATPALAQDPAAASPLSGFLPIILIVAIFYLLIIRPQNKKMQQHRAMIDAVAKGDEIITGGGIHGKVTKVSEGVLTVKIADGVEIQVEQSTLAQVKTKKDAPAAKADKSEAKKEVQSSSTTKSKGKKAANDNG